MLDNRFFEEFEKTKGYEPKAQETLEEKDTYTKAEVEELINRKVGEVLDSIKKSTNDESVPGTVPDAALEIDSPTD